MTAPLFEIIDRMQVEAHSPRLDITRRKHKGNANSDAAHEHVQPTKRDSWQTIYDFITSQGKTGATLHEVVKGTRMKIQTVSGRMSEMKVAGHPFHIFWNGLKRASLDEHGKQTRAASVYVTSEGQLR